MNFQYFLLLVASVILLFSGSFSSGMQNAFGFLFWVNLIILLPIIFIWMLLQFAALTTLFSSPLGAIMAPVISFIGWSLLFVFGINTALCYFISNNADGATSFLTLPIPTQMATVAFVVIAVISSKVKRQKTMQFGFHTSANGAQKAQSSDEVIIDAEVIEHKEAVEHKPH